MRRDSLPSCGRRRIINLDETDESSLSCRIDRPPPGEPVLATLKDLAAFHPRLKGATLGSMVYATLGGSGQRKLLMIAHMDTVYTKGMGVSQPFRVDGDTAYGLGISDDKGGVALILHTVQLLDQLGFKDYAQLGVLINADEEIGSAGSAAFITQLGGEYDAVLSFEGAGFQEDMVRLATSSIATVDMKITGKASHAGSNPEGGRNALARLWRSQQRQREHPGEFDRPPALPGCAHGHGGWPGWGQLVARLAGRSVASSVARVGVPTVRADRAGYRPGSLQSSSKLSAFTIRG